MTRKSDRLIYVVGGHMEYSLPLLGLGTMTDNEEDLTGADLVLFTGGEDVTPSFYGEDPHPYSRWNIKRDEWEKEIFEKAAFHRIPMAGICRGIQWLHVMNGGKLIQHIVGHPFPGHKVVTEDGEAFTSNTFHHQACMNEPDVGNVLALSFPDDVVEAMYYPKTRCFGVQWHPERMPLAAPATKWFRSRVEELMGLNEGTNLLQVVH